MSHAATILIVDDLCSARMVVREILKQAGYLVTEAENGKIALRLAQERSFDLVITDINMPVMGGIELIKKLRNLDEYHLTPIFVLTTENSQEVRDNTMALGATDWIVKELSPGKLLDTLNKLHIKTRDILTHKTAERVA